MAFIPQSLVLRSILFEAEIESKLVYCAACLSFVINSSKILPRFPSLLEEAEKSALFIFALILLRKKAGDVSLKA